MSMSDASTGVSAARFAMNPTPLGAAGLFGGAMLGGKSGPSNPFDPKFKGGTNGDPLMVKFSNNDQWTPARQNMMGTTTPGGMINPNQMVAQRMGVPLESLQQSPWLGSQAPIWRQENAVNKLTQRNPTLYDIANAGHRAGLYNAKYKQYTGMLNA